MKTLVQLQVRSVYGKPRIYPMNETATRLLDLTGRATFNENDIRTIESMGFKIEFLAEQPKFGKAAE